ncbi:hypothetical protein CEP52_010805 [Fusarium oligoseptatum]|uniref:Uncharacterized protein n=1 Tax=Fusarium oligoseptatum TaxID=2604345 RepID=A0A428T6D2_9HYPO|nr:hypothetical protein CEP52_010805 [Fusarium oligoseptatum]
MLNVSLQCADVRSPNPEPATFILERLDMLRYLPSVGMSGFEIAGIVLGGFPILYEAAKTAKSRYQDLKWWWRFETEFEDFISVVDREFISFSLNQEILLSPLDILNNEREILQNDPDTLLWHEPRIQAQLRKRLRNRYYTWASMVDQDRKDLEPKSFILLFDEGATFTELKVEVAELKPTRITPVLSGQTMANVSQLKEDISAKIRSQHARSKSSSLATLAASSLSIVGNPSNSGDGQNRLKWLERRFKKRVRIQNSSTKSDKDPAPLDQPRVRFADVSNIVSDAHGEEIDNICSLARGEVERPFTGFLSASHETRILLQLSAASVSDSENFKVESLEEYLDSTPQRNQRLQVGLQLVQTVLTLGVTPWVPEKCTRMEVLLIRNLDTAGPAPYISHESVRNTFKGKQRVERSVQARATLFTVGVLLLELLFRKTLESLPLRNEFLGKVGVADYTADLCTAIQWQKQVEAEFGDRIADAIRRCVLCAFEPQPDLGDSAFIRAM